MYFFGILIRFPNILFIPSSPKAETAPVANAGTALVIPFTASGSTLAPNDARDVNKFPPCFTDLVICVLLIFISLPVPFARDFFYFSYLSFGQHQFVTSSKI